MVIRLFGLTSMHTRSFLMKFSLSTNTQFRTTFTTKHLLVIVIKWLLSFSLFYLWILVSMKLQRLYGILRGNEWYWCHHWRCHHNFINTFFKNTRDYNTKIIIILFMMKNNLFSSIFFISLLIRMRWKIK